MGTSHESGATLRGQGIDIRREQLGIAINALNPFLEFAVAIELLEQAGDRGQDELGLGGRCVRLKTNSLHLRRTNPHAMPASSLSADLSDNLRTGLFSAASGKLPTRVEPASGRGRPAA